MGISALRGVIRHARSMNRLDLDVADPTAGIPTIPQGKRSRALSDPEVGRLLHWMDSGAVSRTIVDVLRVTLYTGARSGEVRSMRSRDVDIDAKTWTHTQGKTGDVSVTLLSAPAFEILRNRLGDEYGFPVRGNPVNRKAERGPIRLAEGRRRLPDRPMDLARSAPHHPHRPGAPGLPVRDR